MKSQPWAELAGIAHPEKQSIVEHEEKVTFTCKTGYTLSGAETATCNNKIFKYSQQEKPVCHSK